MASTNDAGTVRVAVVQAEAIPFDLDANVAKTCTLIAEASANGAKLIAFPEVFIPGYPFWIWTRGVDFVLTQKYIQNSLRRDSPQMQRIRDAAAKHRIAVSLGYSENDGNSLYIAQSHIGADGALKMNRRKIKPTHLERTVFGDGSGASLLNVVDTDGVGKVGMLSCWEHTQPLLKYHTHSQGEQIHVAAWPPMVPFEEGKGFWSMAKEGGHNLAQNYAIEGCCFVLHANAIISQSTIDMMQTAQGAVFARPGGGASAVFAPDGRKLTKELAEDEEGLVYADLDLGELLRNKSFLDTYGHYSRPDLLWLGVDYREKKHVRPESEEKLTAV